MLYNMRCLVMFITAVCLIFLLKLKWRKNKSVYKKRVNKQKRGIHRQKRVAKECGPALGKEEKQY